MAMDGLPEGVPPSGRVPGQLLQTAPILKRRRQRYRGEFAEKRSILGVSTPRAKYRRMGVSRGPTRQPGGLLAGARGGGPPRAAGGPGGGAEGGPGPGPFLFSWGRPPSATLVIPEASGSLI